jgi:hypothetical protein
MPITPNTKKVIKMTQADLMSILAHQSVPISAQSKTNISLLLPMKASGLFNNVANNECKFFDSYKYDCLNKNLKKIDILDSKLDCFQVNDYDSATLKNLTTINELNNTTDMLNLDDIKFDEFCMKLLQSNEPKLEQEFFENQLFDLPKLPKQTEQIENSVRDNVMLDHHYTGKRKHTSSFTEENEDSLSSFTDDTFFSSSAVSTSVYTPPINCDPPEKKKRTRGVYRADDIRNEEDLASYIERRKKNNMSSKISRANKKCYYNQMDEKAEFLQKQNESLSNKIELLEKVNKMIKEYLIEQFNNK